MQADLFNPPPAPSDSGVMPWRPSVLDREQWPPDYRGVFAWRIKTLAALRSDPAMLKAAHAYYATRPAQWIVDWCDTFDPRRNDALKWIPFILFKRQAEFIDFLEALRAEGENGLVEKCRDMGATWLACAYSVWRWRYVNNDAIGWGSRKQDLVDKLGDVDSIFEKMRVLIRRLPPEFRPAWSTGLMKIINNQNGAVVTGEAGDNIGRGGRKATYFKDESAFYERPELIEAALGDNTKMQVDISTVNGLGNVFHRRRESGEIWTPDAHIPAGVPRVFIFDWRDHPAKDQQWYDTRKAKAEREGMQHIFAQEVDRNYSAAVENTIIAYEWVQAAVDLHLLPQCAGMFDDEDMAGLDIADEGSDKNAFVLRKGWVATHAREWGERDPGAATRNVIADMRERQLHGIKLQYDSVGMGAAVKAEFNRLIEQEVLSYDEIFHVPWHAGAAIVRPFERLIPGDDQTMLNRDFFHNFRAQAWWSVRTRFYKAWKVRHEGERYDPSELISLSSAIPSGILSQLMKELAQPTATRSPQTLKMLVAKKPPGTRSPNLADALVQCFFPAQEKGGGVSVGSYSG